MQIASARSAGLSKKRIVLIKAKLRLLSNPRSERRAPREPPLILLHAAEVTSIRYGSPPFLSSLRIK